MTLAGLGFKVANHIDVYNNKSNTSSAHAMEECDKLQRKWFLATIHSSLDIETVLSCGRVQWSEDYAQFEIWVHISGIDHGYVKGNFNDISEKTIQKLLSTCQDATVIIPIIECAPAENAGKFAIDIPSCGIVLGISREITSIKMEELYRAAMNLFSKRMTLFESTIDSVRAEALSIVENSRNGIILEINKRNDRISELEREIARLRCIEKTKIDSSEKEEEREQVQVQEASPVKVEDSEDSYIKRAETKFESPGKNSHQFMGIRSKRTGTSSQTPISSLDEYGSVPLLDSTSNSNFTSPEKQVAEEDMNRSNESETDTE